MGNLMKRKKVRLNYSVISCFCCTGRGGIWKPRWGRVIRMSNRKLIPILNDSSTSQDKADNPRGCLVLSKAPWRQLGKVVAVWVLYLTHPAPPEKEWQSPTLLFSSKILHKNVLSTSRLLYVQSGMSYNTGYMQSNLHIHIWFFFRISVYIYIYVHMYGKLGVYNVEINMKVSECMNICVCVCVCVNIWAGAHIRNSLSNVMCGLKKCYVVHETIGEADVYW